MLLLSARRRLLTTTASSVPPIEVIRGSRTGGAMLTCEHAGEGHFGMFDAREVEPWRGQHWTHDPGGEFLVRGLAREMKTSAILCHVSRLYCDVNRACGSITLARAECDGKPVRMNERLTAAERARRVTQVWMPYHLQAAALAEETKCTLVASIHTFNPTYQSETRDHVEVGVLSSMNDEVAMRVIRGLQDDGFPKVLLNVPWSGKNGIMFSVDQVAYSGAAPRKSVMIEVRNDLLPPNNSNADYGNRFVKSLARILTEIAR